MAARSTRSVRWLIALVLAAAALVWLWSQTRSPEPKPKQASRAAASEDDAPRAADRRAPTPAPRAPAQRPALPADEGEGCAPHASRACFAGDVYWLNGCDRREDKAEECGARLCRDDACEASDDVACAGLPLQGVCDGNIARGCLAGWPFARDCAALGKRCVMGEEGAECRKPSEDDCDRYGALPRCEGQKLLSCADGKRITRDCAAMDARCETLAQTGMAACVVTSQLERAPRDNDPCGVCGCPEGAPQFDDERCNGSDDDGDGWIDEDVNCEPLQVAAYLITDRNGNGSYTRQDIEQEIANVDALFSSEHGGLRMHVELADVVELARPEYLTFDDEDLGPLLTELKQSATDTGLRVPIVFTDELSNEDVPRAGISTIPNGTCGGVRRTPSPQPLRGLVVVGKRRAPTTVAHELGHFLGLCHTHEADSEAVVRVAKWRTGDGRAIASTCDASCELEGDGICDTPHDPGPESCGYDLACDAHCASGEAPSTHNLMSYYTECRDQLSPLQTIEVHRTRALLEGWYRCADPSACPCVPRAIAATPATTCPEQMSCRPVGAGFGCTLDGAFLQGESCRAHAECGAGLVCLDKRCAP